MRDAEAEQDRRGVLSQKSPLRTPTISAPHRVERDMSKLEHQNRHLLLEKHQFQISFVHLHKLINH